ncbi:MAG: PilZ domain-containing protein [Spirochaetales bacterium]
MGIVMQTSGQQFLSEVAESYIRSPVEVAVFLLSLVVPVVILIMYASHRRRRDLQEWTQESSEFFITEAEKRKLTPSQRDVLFRIAELGTVPWKVHTVFEDEAVFNRGAAALKDRHETADDTISALRLLLGFTRHGGVPISSASLPVGARVALAREGRESVVTGEIRDQKPSTFIVLLDEDSPSLREGKRVRLLYQSGTGVYSFLSDILKKRDRLLAMRHTETVGRSQRRRYYRRRMTMPVAYALADSAEYHDATIVELGGGGATVRLPSNVTVQPGDFIWLRFDPLILRFRNSSSSSRPVHHREITAIAKVIRCSGAGAHVEFTRIREALRDRIIQRLFTHARSQPSESRPQLSEDVQRAR